jgi:hypothetical protein
MGRGGGGVIYCQLHNLRSAPAGQVDLSGHAYLSIRGAAFVNTSMCTTPSYSAFARLGERGQANIGQDRKGQVRQGNTWQDRADRTGRKDRT